MGRIDYDDMDSRNNRRGRKATRMTVLVSLVIILTTAIIIVLYVIMHPSNEISITDKKSEAVKVEESKDDDTLVLFKRENPEEDKEKDTVPSVVIEEVEEDIPVIEEPVDVVIEPVEEDISIIEESTAVEDVEEPISDSDNDILKEELPPLEEEVFYEEIILPEEETPSLDENIEDKNDEITVVMEDEIDTNPLQNIECDTVVDSSSSYYENGQVYIVGRSGSAVHALYSGIVVKSGKEEGRKYIIVLSEDKSAVKYSGFERVTAALRKRYKEGAVLGSIGSSGENNIVLEYIPDYEE